MTALTETTVRALINDSGVTIDVATIPADKRFADVGMDSLDYFNVIAELQDVTGKEIPDDDLERLRTINDIIAYFGESTA